jgi:membrane protein implicated in regulation of membrane protease activity
MMMQPGPEPISTWQSIAVAVLGVVLIYLAWRWRNR